jgi:spermidine/putrescine transport system substrate-binding protein
MNVKKMSMMAMTAAFVLAACGSPAAQPTAAPAATTAPAAEGAATTAPAAGGDTAATGECPGDKSKLASELSWYTWGNYVSDDVMKRFTEVCGVNVKVDVYGSNEEMEAKFKAGGNPGYDLITPSDYMVAKMATAGMLEKIDFNNVPNFANIDASHKGLYFDPNNEYSVAYNWGTTGIAYDKTKVTTPITNWSQIMEPAAELQGKVGMLDDMRELLGMALRYKGFSANTSNPDEINAARDALIAQKKFATNYSDSPTNSTNLVAGDVIAAMIYTNDAVVARSQNPNIEYVIPENVSTIWQDNMAIPTGAPSKYTAEVFINFMLDPKNAADNANAVGLTTPNGTALSQGLISEELRNNKTVFPDVQALGNRLEFLRKGDPKVDELFQRAFDEVKAAQ